MNAVNFHFDNNREWWYQLNEQCQQNGEISFFSNGYVTSFELLHCLSSFTPINSKDAIIGSEGANINDIGCAVLLNSSSRHRLDADHYPSKNDVLATYIQRISTTQRTFRIFVPKMLSRLGGVCSLDKEMSPNIVVLLILDIRMKITLLS
ncbi:uncharacterized protein ACN2A1_010063 isoform 1-T2 [Glossina fuscipes fuscipes]